MVISGMGFCKNKFKIKSRQSCFKSWNIKKTHTHKLNPIYFDKLSNFCSYRLREM